MDWNLAIEREREVLKRILALFLGLAVLADTACGRSRLVRRLVLWVLRPAEAIALREIVETGPASRYVSFAQPRGDSLAEAKRLARSFRAAARAVRKQIKSFVRYQARREADRHDGSLVPVGGHPARYDVACADALLRHVNALPPFVERCDSS